MSRPRGFIASPLPIGMQSAGKTRRWGGQSPLPKAGDGMVPSTAEGVVDKFMVKLTNICIIEGTIANIR